MESLSPQNAFIIAAVFVFGCGMGRVANILISNLQEKEQKAGRRYYVVQLLYAVYLCTLVLKYGLGVQALKLSICGFALVVTAFTDLESKYIYIQVNIIAGVAAVVFNILSGYFIPHFPYKVSIYNMIFGALIGFLPPYILSFFGAMGEGDAWFLGMIGLFMGWEMTLVCLFISIVAGGILSLLLVIFKKYDRKAEIAFGPFIAVGAAVVSLWGAGLWSWYMNTMGM